MLPGLAAVWVAEKLAGLVPAWDLPTTLAAPRLDSASALDWVIPLHISGDLSGVGQGVEHLFPIHAMWLSPRPSLLISCGKYTAHTTHFSNAQLSKRSQL